MSKIIGVTVGTSISPAKLQQKLNPVKTVNGKSPDANGNVELDEIAGYESLTLGVHTDGLIYLFKNGEPQGVGLEIKAEEVEGGDVVGYIDENNNIVLKGNLTEGTYTAKYDMGNNTFIEIGQLVFTYSVTKTLTNCTINNNATSVANGGSYKATISANSGYTLSPVKVTMGGVDISSSAVSGNTISIEPVTGDIFIEATAVVKELENMLDTYGYVAGRRISSGSGLVKTTGYEDYEATNYIPVKYGQIITIENIYAEAGGGCSIALYKAIPTKPDTGTGAITETEMKADYYIAGSYLTKAMRGLGASSSNGEAINGERLSQALTSNAISGISASSGIAYMRFSAKEITENSIVYVTDN